MKKLLYLSIMILAIVASSCEDDKKTSKIPVLGSLTLSPSTCITGNQIKATIKIAEEGELCSFSQFYVEYNTNTIKISSFSRDSLNNITFSFTAPKYDGQLNVSAYATVSMMAGSKPYEQTNTVSSSVFVYQKQQ